MKILITVLNTCSYSFLISLTIDLGLLISLIFRPPNTSVTNLDAWSQYSSVTPLPMSTMLSLSTPRSVTIITSAEESDILTIRMLVTVASSALCTYATDVRLVISDMTFAVLLSMSSSSVTFLLK